MINRKLAAGFAAAAGYIAVALVLKAAERSGLMTHDSVVRAFQTLTGLGLAVYANFIPKNLRAVRDPMMAMRMQSVLRRGGWAFLLGGLGYAAAALLPAPATVGLAVLSAATAYVLGYSIWAYVECSIARRRAA